MNCCMRLSLLIAGLLPVLANAQSSSLMWGPAADARPANQGNATMAAGTDRDGGGEPAQGGAMFSTMDPRDEVLPMTRGIERVSLTAIPQLPPRKYKVHDLVTIIVRQQKKYEADAEMETKKNWNIAGKLSDWFRLYPRNRLGQDKLSNGDPGFKFDFDNKYKTEGESDRQDSFITRITASVVDVKPNGNLVLEAKMEERHDEEVATITITGTCRSGDVTPDNTVLSTQIAELQLVEHNAGAVRDATTRGWVPKILDYAKPF